MEAPILHTLAHTAHSLRPLLVENPGLLIFIQSFTLLESPSAQSSSLSQSSFFHRILCYFWCQVSAGFRWCWPRGPGVVGGPMCGYRIVR